MIDKDIFLNRIEFEDKNRLSNIYDKIELCNKIGMVVYTDEFYPPNVWKAVENMQCNIPVMVHKSGIFEHSERRMIAFSPNEVWDYPIDIIKIENKSEFKKLAHRNYMGAIMGVGIKREKFGDLILKEDVCYVAIHRDLTEYIILNLKNIGSCPCTVEKLDIYKEELPSYDFEDINTIVSSLRIDCVAAALTNLSRNKALDLIKSGKILMDYIVVKTKDTIVKDNIVITIRGFGKFKFIKKTGLTNKGRIKTLFKKFS